MTTEPPVPPPSQKSAGAEGAAAGARPERHRRQSRRIVHRLLGFGDAPRTIFERLERVAHPRVTGDAECGVARKAQRHVVDEVRRPCHDVAPVARIARNIRDVDRREVRVPVSRLFAVVQQRRIHVGRGRDHDHPHEIRWDREHVVEAELRRHRGVGVDLRGAPRELPQALAQAIGDGVGPVAVEHASRLAVLGEAREPTLAEMTERLVVDEELVDAAGGKIGAEIAGHAFTPLPASRPHRAAARRGTR